MAHDPVVYGCLSFDCFYNTRQFTILGKALTNELNFML
jgi:hypothetical protein